MKQFTFATALLINSMRCHKVLKQPIKRFVLFGTHGYCGDAKGEDHYARRFLPVGCDDATSSCATDPECVAYSCTTGADGGELKSVLYTTNGCTADCGKTAWRDDPGEIVGVVVDPIEGSIWNNANCYVMIPTTAANTTAATTTTTTVTTTTKPIKEFRVLMGSGYCSSQNGEDHYARRFAPVGCDDATSSCATDPECVAYSCTKGAVLQSVLYTTDGCTVDCNKTAWRDDPGEIVGVVQADADSPWHNASCYVMILADATTTTTSLLLTHHNNQTHAIFTNATKEFRLLDGNGHCASQSGEDNYAKRFANMDCVDAKSVCTYDLECAAYACTPGVVMQVVLYTTDGCVEYCNYRDWVEDPRAIVAVVGGSVGSDWQNASCYAMIVTTTTTSTTSTTSATTTITTTTTTATTTTTTTTTLTTTSTTTTTTTTTSIITTTTTTTTSTTTTTTTTTITTKTTFTTTTTTSTITTSTTSATTTSTTTTTVTTTTTTTNTSTTATTTTAACSLFTTLAACNNTPTRRCSWSNPVCKDCELKFLNNTNYNGDEESSHNNIGNWSECSTICALRNVTYFAFTGATCWCKSNQVGQEITVEHMKYGESCVV